ncbi:hypothetical protein L21SP3_01279 [Sedimentisphaera cyanobacteriorum]|uniref:Uncharacterized protein n=1 Tax=Sedimentisphaera cyanobacteriorum TaxID=1940790 RepID=A0A1Q2HQB7_9BACT|nr:hypothetical protein L21SP3_01279 [Sedimentisphaera cyanobacteriorum]
MVMVVKEIYKTIKGVSCVCFAGIILTANYGKIPQLKFRFFYRP